MNKKYMDFVPVGTKSAKTEKKNSVAETGTKKVAPKKVEAKSAPKKVAAKKTDIKEIKAKKISGGKVTRPVEKPVEKSEKTGADKKSYKVPNPPFINQEKVTKRPLSKNVYQAKIEEFKEEPRGPVTIISKPEKDSKAGLIVTIILTIILGATAGTVAFLLLPK